MYAALPQHQFPGSQFQAEGRIGRRCRREPSPRIWTRNADKLRFWTENADMFGAPFPAVGFFDRAADRRTSSVRSGAYAHFWKLHGLSGELTFWTGTADVDNNVDCREPFDRLKSLRVEQTPLQKFRLFRRRIPVQRGVTMWKTAESIHDRFVRHCTTRPALTPENPDQIE